MGRMRRRLRLLAALALAAALAACGNGGLPLSNEATNCVHPGEMVTVRTQTTPGTRLVAVVEDDSGGIIAPDPRPVQVPSSGIATMTWGSPPQLSTSRLHFWVTARHQGIEKRVDIHVRVSQPGTSC
jgi:predicted small lipoprotein YifL